MVGKESKLIECEKCGRGDKVFLPGFDSEEASQSAFAEYVDRLMPGCFRMYREVEGYYMSSRPGCDKRGARIDFILQPLKPARDAGWTATIGVECKKSGMKIGKALCQCIDYTYSIFRAGSTYLYPEFIFMWPLAQQYGDMESVMLQNRIGTIEPRNGENIAFKLGATYAMSSGPDGFSAIRSDEIKTGRKTGSR